jgi:hypothetical protein
MWNQSKHIRQSPNGKLFAAGRKTQNLIEENELYKVYRTPRGVGGLQLVLQTNNKNFRNSVWKHYPDESRPETKMNETKGYYLLFHQRRPHYIDGIHPDSSWLWGDRKLAEVMAVIHEEAKNYLSEEKIIEARVPIEGGI